MGATCQTGFCVYAHHLLTRAERFCTTYQHLVKKNVPPTNTLVRVRLMYCVVGYGTPNPKSNQP